MRRHYLLAGVALALALAGVVVVVGLRSGGSTDVAVATADPSLPTGHPAVDGGDADASPSPATGASIEATIAQLEDVRAEDPGDVAALLELGDAYSVGRYYGRAARSYGDVLRLDPGNTAATVRLAMVWHADGDTARAEEAIQSVVADRPGDQEAHYSLAIIYFSTDRVADAKREWAVAADLDPDSEIGRRSRSFVDLLEGEQGGESSASD